LGTQPFIVAAKQGAAGILPAEPASDEMARSLLWARSNCRQDAGSTLFCRCAHLMMILPDLRVTAFRLHAKLLA